MRMYRCWCQHEWDVYLGPSCPRCGRLTDFAPFVRTRLAKGLIEDLDDAHGADPVLTMDPREIEEGEYLDGTMYVGPMSGPKFEAWCKKRGL
jgi:hypothetical protein